MEKPTNFLTDEQKQFPYAKYFDVPYDDITKCPKKLYDLSLAPISQDKALAIEDMNKLLDPAYDADDEGFGVFPDGTGYVAMRMFYPGCTKDMFEWWFAWHGLEDSRYKIWDPRSHYGIAISRKSLAHRTDASLNWKERNWNTSDYVTAWTVNGVQTTRICFMSPESFGFDPELVKKYNTSAVCCISGHPDDPIPAGPSTRVLHEVDGGLMVSLYFWFGYTIIGKKPVRIPGFQCDPAVPALQVTHCAEEYNHLGKFLASVYDENHIITDKPENFKTMPF